MIIREKKNKKILKKEQGITIIALVITIIVLIILAGISIAGISGKNGIIKQGDKAKEKQKYQDTEQN